MSKQPERERHIEAVMAAFDVLRCFAAGPGLHLSEIVHQTGLNRSRVIRLCGTLEAQGCLNYDANSGIYRLGHLVFVLGKAYERENSLSSLGRPLLSELTAKTGETASLFVRNGDERLCIARIESPQPVRYGLREGERFPLHLGASSRVLLTGMSQAEKSRVFSEAKLSPNACQEIDLHLADVVRDGMSVSRGERLPGVCAIAAPVFDHAGRLVAALALAGPDNRLNETRVKRFADDVIEAAHTLSRELGFTAGSELRAD